MDFFKQHGHKLLSLFVAFVFIQSLFFKFTDSPETIYIFQVKLEPWAQSLGFSGLFLPSGIFGAYAVGSIELMASVLILIGTFICSLRLLQAVGALVGLGVISGAIFFHLFTPLGVAVVNADGSSDGGQLFIMACGVWLSCITLIFLRRALLINVVKKLLGQR